MDEGTAILRYIELLLVTFLASSIKTLIFKTQYGMIMNDVICIELLIAIIITQSYLMYARGYGHFTDIHIIMIILINITFTTAAWIFGTTDGLRGLMSHPNIYH